MTGADIVLLLTALFKFPGAILELVKLLQKTPQEKHQDLIKKIVEEANKFEETGRPTWG